MSPRLAVALAVTIAIALLGALGAVMLRSVVDDAGRGRAPQGTAMAEVLDGAVDASEPFAGLTEVRLALDGRCLRTLVADDLAERNRGLREVASLDRYDAMLFVFGGDTDARFTMADTLVALDVGWFSADGLLVDRARMEPCPEGSDADCPTYGPPTRYRYALETAAGGPTGTTIGPCS